MTDLNIFLIIYKGSNLIYFEKKFINRCLFYISGRSYNRTFFCIFNDFIFQWVDIKIEYDLKNSNRKLSWTKSQPPLIVNFNKCGKEST